MTELERAAALRDALGEDLDPVAHGSICPVHPTHKIALVGEAPGPNTRPDLPFYPYPPNSAAGRLKTYLGWERRRYLATFARANLLQEYPGPSFPVVRGRVAACRVAEELAPRPLLLMGKGVAQSFMLPADVPVLEWRYVNLPLADLRTGKAISARVAVVPHTSGRNLWYNDPANRERVRVFVEEACLG